MTHAAPHLEALARRALVHYNLQAAQLTLFGTSETTIFRVDGESDKAFALRLHTAVRANLAALESELQWLESLSKVMNTSVPTPVRSITGMWVVPLGETHETAPWATLLSWVDGEVLGAPLNLEQAAQAAAVLANLHRQAEVFRPPANFTQFTYDVAYFWRRWQDLQAALGPAHLNTAQAAVVEAKWDTLTALLHPMHHVPGGFGLIHGDAHPGSFVSHSGDLHIIDFGRLGWGAYLLDVAYCVLDMEPPERAAFLESYRRMRDVREGHEAHLKALMYLSALDNLAFLAQRPHELEFGLDALPSLLDAIAKLKVA